MAFNGLTIQTYGGIMRNKQHYSERCHKMINIGDIAKYRIFSVPYGDRWVYGIIIDKKDDGYYLLQSFDNRPPTWYFKNALSKAS